MANMGHGTIGDSPYQGRMDVELAQEACCRPSQILPRAKSPPEDLI